MFESEERIVERIKDYIKKEGYPEYYHIMLRNGRIIYIDNYRNMVSDGRINPQDAYVYIGIGPASFKTDFYYPFLDWYESSLDAYLSKLGFYYGDHVFPATGLKYVVVVERYENYLAIEIINLDTVVNNTNLRTIVFEVLGDKIISGEKELTQEEYNEIEHMYKSQQLFAGHDVNEAFDIISDYYGDIISDYYDECNKSSAKEVARIVMDYDRIFNPHRVCYDMKTWKEINCLSIKLV